MDKSLKFSPEQIVNSMKAFYSHLKDNTPFAKEVKQLMLGSAGALAMFTSNPAFAEAEKIMPSGQVSYS